MDNTYILHSRRNEYLSTLQKHLVPIFMEGVFAIYGNVKSDNKVKKYLLKEFQQSMVDVSRWSQEIIKNEHMRFMQQYQLCDKLIQAIFELDIQLKHDLTPQARDFIPKPDDFVHQCYLNVARSLWKQPFLVYDVNIDKLTCQKNKLKVEKIIKDCIKETFLHYLPIDMEDYININIHTESASVPKPDTLDANVDVSDILVDERIEPFVDVVNDVGTEACHDGDGDEHDEHENNTRLVEVDSNDSNDEREEENEGLDEPYNSDEEDIKALANLDEDDMDEIDEIDEIDVIDDIDRLEELEDIPGMDDEDGLDGEDSIVEAVDEFESDSFDDKQSISSENLFVQRTNTDEAHDYNDECYNVLERIETNKINQTAQESAIACQENEIKEVYIGKCDDTKQLTNKHNDKYEVLSDTDVRIINIDDKGEKMKSLLTLKKKIKSSVNERHERHERHQHKSIKEIRKGGPSFF
jgi:hypothetical protein